MPYRCARACIIELSCQSPSKYVILGKGIEPTPPESLRVVATSRTVTPCDENVTGVHTEKKWVDAGQKGVIVSHAADRYFPPIYVSCPRGIYFSSGGSLYSDLYTGDGVPSRTLSHKSQRSTFWVVGHNSYNVLVFSERPSRRH